MNKKHFGLQGSVLCPSCTHHLNFPTSYNGNSQINLKIWKILLAPTQARIILIQLNWVLQSD